MNPNKKSTAHQSAKPALLILALLIFSVGPTHTSFALEEVNLHVSAGISGNSLLYKFAIEKGFYRETPVSLYQVAKIRFQGFNDLDF